MNASVRVPISLSPGGERAGSLAGSFSTPNDTDLVSGLAWGEFETAFQSGLVYINLHTAQYPGGEIRGQIEASDVNAIPEPSTLALLGLGFAFVAYKKRSGFKVN